MKKQFFSYLLILLIIGISCSESDDEEIKPIKPPDSGMAITISNQEGLDLLDSTNNFYFKEGDIRIYHGHDNGMTLYYAKDMNVSNGFQIFSPEELAYHWGDYTLFNFVTNRYILTREIKEFDTTYIRWSETDMDTVRCQNEIVDNCWKRTKVWYNGNLKWDYYESNIDPELGIIHILKNI